MTRGELLEMLERVQWGDHDSEESPCCPVCHAYGPHRTISGKDEGGVHEPGCVTQKAITALRTAGHLEADIAELNIYDAGDNDE